VRRDLGETNRDFHAGAESRKINRWLGGDSSGIPTVQCTYVQYTYVGRQSLTLKSLRKATGYIYIVLD